VDFWYPASNVVSFKRSVYRRALHHLAPLANDLLGCEVNAKTGLSAVEQS
jgi:putative (di)nucleoside polyphosphate hydrolase